MDTPEGDGPGDPPSFDEWEDPDELLTAGPIRERLLDVVVQLREPTPVAAIADRADCDPETAREYLSWFAEMGIVREHSGRPVRYERSESYFHWRRVEEIRRTHTDAEIASELESVVDEIAAYEDRFGAEDPNDVSLADASDSAAVADRWEALSDWKTARRRAELLDAARRRRSTDESDSRIDA